MTKRVAAVVALLMVLPLAEGRPAAAVGDETCARPRLHIWQPAGFADARLSFAGLLKNGRTRVGEHFASGILRELRVIVTWREAEHVHVQRLDLYSPDGSLYQRFTTPFTGRRFPVAVVTRVPVAGSSIVDSGLYGAWCAEVFLDDDDAPIARRRFELHAPGAFGPASPSRR